MKQSTIITILACILAAIILSLGFVLLTDNNISRALFPKNTTTTPSSQQPPVEYEPMDFFKTDVSPYITLGDYKGLTVGVEIIEVTDEFINEQIDQLMISNGDVVMVEKGFIEEGTIFSFDYTGYLNGEAFEGGSAKDTRGYISGTTLYLLSGDQFIPGFAEGMLGKEVGSEFELDIKFPDNYHVADLVGKDTVFNIKINAIIEAAEFTDELANEYSSGNYPTKAEFLEYAVKYFTEVVNNTKTEKIWKEIAQKSTFHEIPKQEYDYFYNYYYSNIEYYASMTGMTPETFLSSGYANYFLGYTFTSLKGLEEYVTDLVKQELVIFAIMQNEGITVSDEEYNVFLDELVQGDEMTKEDIIKEYGEQYIRENIQMKKTEKFVLDNNYFVVEEKE